MNPFNPSRVDKISSKLIGHGLAFDMLRDDLIHPIISGNKWRKLKYIIEFALNNNINDVVSFGGAYSNHLVALAAAGAHFGIKTHGFVRGNDDRPLNHYEQLCIQNGMNLIHVSREDFKDKATLFKHQFGDRKSCLMVGEGGDHPLALKGAGEILNDLSDTYDTIVLALGTGTTMEGLVAEIQNRKLNTKVIGISSLKNNFDLDERMRKYPSNSYKIMHEYHRGKYASNDTELNHFVTSFYEETGIMTEFVYTAKMLMALNDLYLKSDTYLGSKILCIHTGGLLNFPDSIKNQ
ncbi:MAG TPA: pyridoxal-phosphate dependent enzyme [Bacteroidia bacterium]